MSVLKPFVVLMLGLLWPGMGTQAFGPGQPARLVQCADCHSPGSPRLSQDYPLLAGQPKTFLENQMIMIREGLREIPMKKGIFDNVSDQEIILIAQHFSKQRIGTVQTPKDNALFLRGEKVAKDLLCGTCHLPNYAGRDQMPRLAGQHESYLLNTMRKFRNNQAVGRDTIMAASLYGVHEDDLRAMAHYFSQLDR
jgi:cytochrome c553